MSIDEQHVALPKLFGAPAYARPAPVAVATVPRPIDPDELPIEALMTEEDREFASSLPARAWAPGGAVVDFGQSGHTHDGQAKGSPELRPKLLKLRSIAGKLLSGD